MKTQLSLSILIFIFIIGRGCKDDGFESFELNSFERSVIPFENEITKEFTTNNSQIITAEISKKTIQNYNLNSSDDESCFTSLRERHECTYKFENNDKIY